MSDLQVKSLKKVDADIRAMLKLNDPPVESIEKFLKRMEGLIKQMDGKSSFSELKGEWLCRFNELQESIQFVANFNVLKEELPDLQLYTQALLDADLTSETVKQTLDKFFQKVNKIVAIKSALAEGSIPKDGNELKSPQSSGFGSEKSVNHSSPSNRTELSKPADVTPNVTVSFYFKKFLIILVNIYNKPFLFRLNLYRKNKRSSFQRCLIVTATTTTASITASAMTVFRPTVNQ